MNHFITKVFIASFSILSFLIIALVMMMLHIGRWDEIAFADVYKRKQIQQIKERKIVFVGGSNLSYGMDSQRVQDSLHITTYNMGIHAGFGLHFMLEEIENYIQSNDILVIIPEYHQFSNCDGSGVLADLIIQDRRWDDFWMYKDWGSYPSYFCSKVYIPFVIKSMSGGLKKDPYADNPEGFNEKGDYVLHLDQARRTVSPLIVPTPSKKVIKKIVSKVNQFKQQGVLVVFLPPCFQVSSFDKSDENIFQIEADLISEDLPLDAPVERYCFHDTLFWNTAYHLTQSGREIRTGYVIEDIKKQLKMSL